MKKHKKFLFVSVVAAVFFGIAMVITGLSKGFGNKLILDCTIILFSVSIFIVFLSYLIYRKGKGEETNK
jgi:hypothetical protein